MTEVDLLLHNWRFWIATVLYAGSLGGAWAYVKHMKTGLDKLSQRVNTKVDEPACIQREASYNRAQQEMKQDIRTNRELVVSHYAEIQRFMGRVEAKLEIINGNTNRHK